MKRVLTYMLFVFMCLPLTAVQAQNNPLQGTWTIKSMVPLDNIIFSMADINVVEGYLGNTVEFSGRSMSFFYKTCQIHRAQKETLVNEQLSQSGHWERDWGRLGLTPNAAPAQDGSQTYDVVSIDVYCPNQRQKSRPEDFENVNLDALSAEERDLFFKDKYTVFVANQGRRVLLSIKGHWVELEKI